MSDTTIGITGELSSGHSAVCKWTSEHESARWINETFEVSVESVLRRHDHHQCLDDRCKITDLGIFTMLHRAEEGRDTSAVIVVAHLCLCIRHQHRTAETLQLSDETGSDRKRKGQEFRCFVCCVAVHDALVSGASLINAHGDVRGLLTDKAPYIHTVIEAVKADAAEDTCYDLCIVRCPCTCQFSGDDDGVVLDKTFNSYTAVLIVLKAVCDDGIRDLVTDLIYVPS